MNVKLLACLACSTALLVGACSGGNPPAGSGTGSGTPGDDTNGEAPDDDNGDSGAAQRTELERQATAAIALATNAAPGARAAARDEIQEVIDAIDAAVKAAKTASDASQASATATPTERLAAYDRYTRLLALQDTQTRFLNEALTSIAWFGREVVRASIPNGEVVAPRDGTNVVTIGTAGRTPRTITPSAAGSSPQANEAAIKSTTFKAVMYEADKVLLSGGGRKAAPSVTRDTFKVDGYTYGMMPTSALDTVTHTGLKLTNTGLEIQIGGEGSDYTDMRKKVDRPVNNRAAEGTADTPSGQNGWDLRILFDEPKSTSVAGAQGPTSWQGNGDFYWRGIVKADPSQLTSGEANFESGTFTQPKTPEDFRDLGTYEVWLSNHIELDKNLEPPEGAKAPCSPGGVAMSSCPGDDENRYLNYAAYGLFTYKVDTETADLADRIGRVQSMHFGYQAFADEDGKRTQDISKTISSGIFTGQTLATAIEGTQAAPKTTLLRGKVSLTVSIPKDSGTGSVSGTLSEFEEWVGDTNWKDYSVTNFSVTFGSAEISAANGSYSGTATASGDGAALGSTTGSFRGNFYGPRTDADLETAGSWDVGRAAGSKTLVGSFGAKQKSAAASN